MSWFANWSRDESYQQQQKDEQKKHQDPKWTLTESEKENFENYVKLWETGLWKANETYVKQFNDLEAAVLRTLDKMIREQLVAGQLVYVPIFNSMPFVSIVEQVVISCSTKLPDGKFAYILKNDGYIPMQFPGYARLGIENSSSGQYPRGLIFPRFVSSEKLIRALFHNQEVMFCPH